MGIKIRYDTRCYFNVRSKADISRLNLPHAETTTKHCKRVKLKVKTAYARGNRKSLRNYVVSAEEEKERLQWEGFAEKKKVSAWLNQRIIRQVQVKSAPSSELTAVT